MGSRSPAVLVFWDFLMSTALTWSPFSLNLMHHLSYLYAHFKSFRYVVILPSGLMHHKVAFRGLPSILYLHAALYITRMYLECGRLWGQLGLQMPDSPFAPSRSARLFKLSLHDSPSYRLRTLLSAHCKGQPSTRFRDGVPWVRHIRIYHGRVVVIRRWRKYHTRDNFWHVLESCLIGRVFLPSLGAKR